MPSRTTRETQALISRAICEVIDSIVAPRVREIVLDDALAGALEPTVPTDPEKLYEFVHGPLRDALIQAVGEASVDALSHDLERIVALVSGPPRARSTLESAAVAEPARRRRRSTSSKPRFPAVTTKRATLLPLPKGAPAKRPTPVPQSKSAPPKRHTPAPVRSSTPPLSAFRSAPTPRFPASYAPGRVDPSVPPISSGPFPRGTAQALSMAGIRSSFPPTGPAVSPLVVVASERADLARRLSKSLVSYVDLITVRSVLDLVREVGCDDGGRVVVLIDCDAPSVRPIAVAALAEDLPSTVQVVLWGASPELRARLVSISPRCQTWIGIDQGIDVEDVAGRCAILVC